MDSMDHTDFLVTEGSYKKYMKAIKEAKAKAAEESRPDMVFQLSVEEWLQEGRGLLRDDEESKSVTGESSEEDKKAALARYDIRLKNWIEKGQEIKEPKLVKGFALRDEDAENIAVSKVVTKGLDGKVKIMNGATDEDKNSAVEAIMNNFKKKLDHLRDCQFSQEKVTDFQKKVAEQQQEKVRIEEGKKALKARAALFEPATTISSPSARPFDDLDIRGRNSPY
jgi:hypothetical protein